MQDLDITTLPSLSRSVLLDLISSRVAEQSRVLSELNDLYWELDEYRIACGQDHEAVLEDIWFLEKSS
jgi:hypothetical protein